MHIIDIYWLEEVHLQCADKSSLIAYLQTIFADEQLENRWSTHYYMLVLQISLFNIGWQMYTAEKRKAEKCLVTQNMHLLTCFWLFHGVRVLRESM